jgi:hypothetical protein
MKDPKEFAITSLLFMLLIGITNFAILKYEMSHFQMNGQKFKEVGMMEYRNPADGRMLYFLMYTKGDK